MVLLVLIVLWSIVLVPPAWQSYSEARRARQVDAFRRKLSVLAPAPDTPLARRPMDAARPFEAARAHVAVMASRNVVRLPVAEAQAVEFDTDEHVAAVAAEAAARRAERARARVEILRRRQQVLLGLSAATVVSLTGAVLLGDVRLWAAHALTLTAAAAYLVSLRQLKKQALERRTKVHYLPATPTPERDVEIDLTDGHRPAVGDGSGPIRAGRVGAGVR